MAASDWLLPFGLSTRRAALDLLQSFAAQNWAAAMQRKQPLGVSDATAAVAKKAELAIPHRPRLGSVAAFDRTVHIASDEFSVINQ